MVDCCIFGAVRHRRERCTAKALLRARVGRHCDGVFDQRFSRAGHRYAHPYTKSDEVPESDSSASEQREALGVVGRRAPGPDSDGATRGHR